MPKYPNKFDAPAHIQATIIVVDTGEVIGTIRVKPSRILWRPKGQHDYYSVSLNDFAGWITSRAANAQRTGS